MSTSLIRSVKYNTNIDVDLSIFVVMGGRRFINQGRPMDMPKVLMTNLFVFVILGVPFDSIGSSPSSPLSPKLRSS
jgi:hypothetical protein